MEKDFSEYMNPPEKPNGKAYKEFYKNGYWICCPWCGKKQFPIKNDTEIKNMIWKCKGSGCKKEFEVNTWEE